jgi:multidrug efflux pump subunit AcrA (membrane-fusion protein)
VEAYPGSKFEGRVAYVSPSVDPETRTFPIEILVDNRDKRLKPGFFAKGFIYTHKDDNVMAVPENAISTLAGISNVYVIEKDTARQQEITPGARVGDLVEVLGGLKGDEILAASNLSLLATGVQVAIEPSTGAGRTDIAPGSSSGKSEGGRP